MGVEYLSVLALGEARDSLAALRRNSRFSSSSVSQHAPAEHPLVTGIKSVKDIVRAGSVATSSLNAQRVLDPFLDIILSADANSIITAAALTSVEKIVGRCLALDAAADAPSAKHPAITRDALQSVLHAAANCKFDPTEPSQDELVLAGIAHVVGVCIVGGDRTATRRLADFDILLGFNACLRIAANPRSSGLLKKTAVQVLTDIVAYLTVTLVREAADQPANSSAMDDVEQSPDPDLAQSLYHALRRTGIMGSFVEAMQLDRSSQWSTLSLCVILRTLSYMIDPASGKNSAIRSLGLILLNAALTSSNNVTILMNSPDTCDALERDASRALLRTLGSFREPMPVVSLAFSVAHATLYALGPYGGCFLAALWTRVFPAYVEGHINGREIDYGVREIGLDALGAIFAHKGMLSLAFASLDCNPRQPDGVELMLSGLGKVTEEAEALHSGNRSTLDGLGQEQDEDSGVEDTRATVLRAPALQCAETLLAAVDSIGDRLRAPNPNSLLSPSVKVRGVHVKSVDILRERKLRKRKRGEAAGIFNASHGKRGARGVAVILRQFETDTSKDSKPVVTPASPASDFTDADVDNVVAFLRETPGLDKASIGVVLSEPDPLSQKTLRAYCDGFDFAKRSFTDCIRVFLESFRLPGEAQKIDRIMHGFARSYFEQTVAHAEGKATPLVSADSAFVLSFSVVMLNTDQHNSSVKKKMTRDDFVKNNRGINEGDDVPRDFLEEIYNSILETEIRMSDESGIGLLTDVHWSEMLREARLAREDHIVYPDDPRLLDENVFSCLWKPAVSAAVLLLENALDAQSAQKALEGFLSLARSAVAFRTSKPADACIGALCAATTLLEGSLNDAVVRFGSSIKAQMASVALFGVTRECGDWIRFDGWRVIILVVIRLHLLGLLPRQLEVALGSYGSDIADPHGCQLPPSKTIPSWWPSYIPPDHNRGQPLGVASVVSQSSLFSFLNFGSEEASTRADPGESEDGRPSFLVSEEDDDFVADAANLSRKCILDCRIDEVLINETRFFSHEAFESLLSSLNKIASEELEAEYGEDSGHRKPKANRQPEDTRLVSMLKSSRLSLRADDNGPNGYMVDALSIADEKKARHAKLAFCLDLACELTVRNRDRLAVVWPVVHGLITRVLAPAAGLTPLLERAVVGLLRIAIRFMHREEVRDDVLRSLSLLVKLPSSTAAGIGTPLAAGIFQVTKTHSMHITTTSGWHTIMSILENCARYPDPAPAIGFEALQFLIIKDPSSQILNPETFAVFLDAVYFYASSPLVCSITAGDLLLCLAHRVASLDEDGRDATIQSDPESECVEPRRWVEYWSPLLLAFSQLCRDERPDVRNHAWNLFEETVRAEGPTDKLSLFEKSLLMETILFPLTKDIFDPDGVFASRSSLRRKLGAAKGGNGDSSPENKSRLKAMVVVSRVFLQNHKLFGASLKPDQMLSLWVGVLTCFQKSLADDSGAGDGLKDHLLEMLKNIVLVAHAGGVFCMNEGRGWTKTEELTRAFIPDLPRLIENCEPDFRLGSSALTGAAEEGNADTVKTAS